MGLNLIHLFCAQDYRIRMQLQQSITEQIYIIFDQDFDIVSYDIPDSISALVRTKTLSLSNFSSFTKSFDYYYNQEKKACNDSSCEETLICLEKYFDDYTISIRGVIKNSPHTKRQHLEAEVSRTSNNMLQFSQLIEVIINEIRNPIAGLIATSDLYLNYGQEFKLDKDEYFTISRDYANKLSQFVDQIINLLKVDSSAISKDQSPIHAQSLLQNCIEKERKKLSDLNIKLNTNFDDSLYCVGNEELIRVAFANLLQNSVLYGNPDREIQLRIFNQNGYIGISFKDNGFGIDAGDATRIFDRFFRVRKTTVKNHPEGIGIGLTLVKSIVRHQNGKLQLSSIPEQGSEFTLFLPELKLKAEPYISVSEVI